MGMLERVQSGKMSAPRRTMIYGTLGIGKSTFASMAEKPIFIQTEDGLGEIGCKRFPLATSLDEVMASVSDLYTEKHDYKTVVIDTLDWMERIIWDEVCKKRNVASIEDIGYAKGYTFALTHWRNLLDGLTALRRDKGMAIVLVAHAKIERFESPETESYDRYVPRLHKLSGAIIQEWCDEILFAVYEVHTKQTDEGFNRKKVKGVGTGVRIMRTTERPPYIAKNRLNMPDELPLDWSAYKQFMNSTKTTNEKGKDNNGQS